ncbi:hypothetical protein TWF730_005015 [Orbilia blumenaviensis]|uniref:LisH domain-containing protein n=1 Tax=Orbilia blumenaviensis TaxID=1796055 RepID=A0AAV9VKB5_9PEZI
MPANDSPDVLVARFLRANGYHETFQAFLRETNLTADSITDSPTDPTIEKILEEKKLYDLAVRFEKVDVKGVEDVGFRVPYPTSPTLLPTPSTTSNILSTTLTTLILPSQTSPQQVIISTSSDKSLTIHTASPPYTLISTFRNIHAGPILSVAVISQRWLVTGSMVGDIAVSDLKGEVLQRWKGHAKYIVKLAVSDAYALPKPNPTKEDGEEEEEEGEIRYLAAASHDKSLSLHKLHIPTPSSPSTPSLSPLQTIKFDQTVEDVIFTKDYRHTNPTPTPQDPLPLLLIATIRDSPTLHIYSLSTPPKNEFIFTSNPSLTATQTSWLTYTPTSLTPHPHNPHLIALITSTPKIIIYNLRTFTVDKEFGIPVELSAYSTGVVAWRGGGDLAGSGIWVNGDDGVVKGVDVSSGKVVAELKGHKGRKVRCLTGGTIFTKVEGGGEEEEEEVMISGGFDGGLNIWRIAKEQEVSV